MKTGLVELLELYEYKVDDLISGVEPKGGMVSLTRLRQMLIQANLSGPLVKKFREIDARFKSNRPGYKTVIDENFPAPPGLETIVVEEETGGSDPEREVLIKFAEMVYWSRLERDLNRSSKTLNQGKRDELRMVFALLQNLETYSKNPQFTQDYNLSRFVLTHAIPSASDPRAKIEDGFIGTQLFLDLFRQAFTLNSKLTLPPEETVPYFKRFARRILESEGAMKTNLKGPSSEALRRAVEEAYRQKLSAPEIRSLEERMAATAAEERRMALVASEDRARFNVAIERIMATLTRYLPTPKGEAQWPQVPHKIWGAQSPEFRLEELPSNAKALTVRLRPQRFNFAGHEVGVSQAGDLYGLSIAGQERTVEDQQSFHLTLPNAELYVHRLNDYIHLHIETREAATLSNLLAEGRLLAYLMWPGQSYGYLRLVRALSSRLKGDMGYSAFQAESASRYGEAPLDSLQDFARKGVEIIRNRIERNTQWEGLLEEAGRALGLEAYVPALKREIIIWLGFQVGTHDTLGANVGSTTVGDRPSSVRAGNTVLSLRYQEDTIYVSNSGSIPRKLQDVLVWIIAEGGVVLAREGVRVAHHLVNIS